MYVPCTYPLDNTSIQPQDKPHPPEMTVEQQSCPGEPDGPMQRSHPFSDFDSNPLPILYILATAAEFNRSLYRERTRAGLAAAKMLGQKLGRPRALSPSRLSLACRLLANCKSMAAVARRLRVARSTLYVTLRDCAASANSPAGEPTAPPQHAGQAFPENPTPGAPP